MPFSGVSKEGGGLGVKVEEVRVTTCQLVDQVFLYLFLVGGGRWEEIGVFPAHRLVGFLPGYSCSSTLMLAIPLVSTFTLSNVRAHVW